MDNTINQTIIEKVVIQKTAIYKAIAMLPPPEIKDLWAEKNSTDQKVNLTKKEEFVKENSITETKTDSTPKDWRDITDPKLRKKMRKKEDDRKYREKHKDKVKLYKKTWHKTNKNRLNAKSKSYYEANKETLKLKKKAYREVNKDKVKEREKAYRTSNKNKLYEYDMYRYKNNIQRKISCRLRSRLRDVLKSNYKAGSAVKDLGCSIDELKNYLESKFQPGMTWDNWTTDGWHIDHIKPLASFDLTDRKQFLEACHYTNLQPLWANDNLIKSDKLI